MKERGIIIDGTKYPMPENSKQEQDIFVATSMKANQIRHSENLHGKEGTLV